MKLNQICEFMIFIIVIIVKHESTGRCMYGTDGMNKWHGKQDSQLSLRWGRPHALRPTDDNDDKGSTLSLQLSGRPNKSTEKWWTTKQSLSNTQRKNDISSRCWYAYQKKRLGKMGLGKMRRHRSGEKKLIAVSSTRTMRASHSYNTT